MLASVSPCYTKTVSIVLQHWKLIGPTLFHRRNFLTHSRLKCQRSPATIFMPSAQRPSNDLSRLCVDVERGDMATYDNVSLARNASWALDCGPS
jgi:hypothetical protein